MVVIAVFTMLFYLFVCCWLVFVSVGSRLLVQAKIGIERLIKLLFILPSYHLWYGSNGLLHTPFSFRAVDIIKSSTKKIIFHPKPQI